ncbi:MAG: endonuclease/exonuclease/phosphatase family protein [Spirochaetaceae bacterium]|jgi:endonuclease/exonuclease/phosphatase family metal-dependent hydrolase|nr:endonuclease/exonuclease/phosphatase family protein [Spirochaetaceae bacterium]
MKKYVFLTVTVSFFPLLCSCFGSCGIYPGEDELGKDKTISIMSWNVQALFDGNDDGIEYDEYRASGGWNAEKYQARLASVAGALAATGENGPDVVVLLELENAGVLENLGGGGQKMRGYPYRYFAGNKGYSLGVGVMSRFKITKHIAHSSNRGGERIPRPVAEIWLEPGEKPIVLFICHWKSKLGGDEATENLRREAAKLILRRTEEIHAEYPRIPVLVAGDLNENHDEFYRREGEAVCAIMPDDPDASKRAGFLFEEYLIDNSGDSEEDMALSGWDNEVGGCNMVFVEESPGDFLVISEEKPPKSAYFPFARTVFYSPWSTEIDNGSYYYQGTWETIDHFLLSQEFWLQNNWNFKNAAALNVEPFVNSKGEPASYNPRTGSGISDHLPLLLLLTFAGN